MLLNQYQNQRLNPARFLRTLSKKLNKCITLNVKLLLWLILIYWVADCACLLFQISCRGLMEPDQRDRRSQVDGYRDNVDLDTVHHPSCARGNSLWHDHHGLQRRTLADLFAAPHAENWIYEGELQASTGLSFSVEKNREYWHSCERWRRAHVIHTDSLGQTVMQILTNSETRGVRSTCSPWYTVKAVLRLLTSVQARL